MNEMNNSYQVLFQAAERLSNEELDERIAMYEEKKSSRQDYKSMTTVDWLYHKLFREEALPLILDNVNPFFGPEARYNAAVEVRNFRREQDGLEEDTTKQ